MYILLKNKLFLDQDYILREITVFIFVSYTTRFTVYIFGDKQIK